MENNILDITYDLICEGRMSITVLDYYGRLGFSVTLFPWMVDCKRGGQGGGRERETERETERERERETVTESVVHS